MSTVAHTWHIKDVVVCGVPGVMATCEGCEWTGPVRPPHHLMRAGLDGGRHIADARLDQELAQAAARAGAAA